MTGLLMCSVKNKIHMPKQKMSKHLCSVVLSCSEISQFKDVGKEMAQVLRIK